MLHGNPDERSTPGAARGRLAATTTATVLEAARAARVETLLVGVCAPWSGQDADPVDLAVIETVRHGGEVLEVGDALGTELGALLRY